ncbi:MAG: hypothetical protein ACP5QT_02555 [Brevinematia bacterium]
MKKLCLLLSILIISYCFAFSDEENFISFGFDSGYLIDGYMKGGWGAGGIFEIRLLEKFSFIADAGYIEYREINNNLTNFITTVTIQGIVRWYPFGGITGVYAGAGFGTFYSTVSDEKVLGYMIPLETGIKLTFFGSKGIFLEPDIAILLKYGNSRFLIGMKYGLNIGFTF